MENEYRPEVSGSGWEGNRRSGVVLAVRHRLCASSSGLNCLRKTDMHKIPQLCNICMHMLHATEVMAIFLTFWPILAKIWLPWQRPLDLVSNITRTRSVSEYTRVLALCLVYSLSGRIMIGYQSW